MSANKHAVMHIKMQKLKMCPKTLLCADYLCLFKGCEITISANPLKSLLY